MIVKIDSSLMSGAVLKPEPLPEGFEYFPCHEEGGFTFCHVTHDNMIAVPFQVATVNDLHSATSIVGESLLSDYGLLHGQ